MRTRTTIHDVRTVFVRSKGPNDFMVSALMAMCGVGPRRKTKPNRKRTMSPIATNRPRLNPINQIPLSSSSLQHFQQEKEGPSQPHDEPREQARDREEASRIQQPVQLLAADDPSHNA